MSAVFCCSVKVVIRNNNLTIMVFHEDEVNGDPQVDLPSQSY